VIRKSPRGLRYTVGMILVGLIAGSIVAAIALAVAERSPALRILAQEDAGAVAQNDGRILIFSKINRNRSCVIETTHWLFTLVDHAGETVRAYVPIAEDGPVPVHALGRTDYVLTVPLPPGLWPGKWYWLESRTEMCGPFGSLWPIYSESAPLALDIERSRAIADVPVTALQDGATTTRSRSPALAPEGKPP
jgi:hypothetical protein